MFGAQAIFPANTAGKDQFGKASCKLATFCGLIRKPRTPSPTLFRRFPRFYGIMKKQRLFRRSLRTGEFLSIRTLVTLQISYNNGQSNKSACLSIFY